MQGYRARELNRSLVHGSVVLVEDDPVDLDLILRALGRCLPVPAVTVVRDGEAALELVADWRDGTARPALVLLDLKLPRMSGLEVLRALRLHYAAKTLPVVVLTSSSDPCDIAAAYAEGANAYVVKPLRFEDLIETARDIQRFWCMRNTTLD